MRKLIALLLMTCLLFSAAAAQEIAPDSYALGRAAFRLPENTFGVTEAWRFDVTVNEDEGSLQAVNEAIYLTIDVVFVDYTGVEDVDALSDADVFTDSAAYMLSHCFGHHATLAMETLTAMFTDAGESGYTVSLPEGDKAKISAMEGDGMCFLTHYVDNAAFMISVSSPIYPAIAPLLACGIADSLTLGEAKAAEPDVPLQHVVVKNYNAKVRTEPSTTAKLIKTVFGGTTLPLLGESGDFYMVDMNGQVGYIHKSTCEIQ